MKRRTISEAAMQIVKQKNVRVTSEEYSDFKAGLTKERKSMDDFIQDWQDNYSLLMRIKRDVRVKDPIIKEDIERLASRSKEYAQFKSKDYRPSLSKDTLYQKVHEALNSFRLSYTYDEDREGLQLVDRLTPPQDEDVTRGLQEIEYLTDHIVGEITDCKDNIPERDSQWINVDERLPDNEDQFCVFAKWYTPWNRWTTTDAMYWKEIRNCRQYDLENEYTHWMPLPSPPVNPPK